MATREIRSPNDARPVRTVSLLSVLLGVFVIQLAIFGVFAAFVFPPDLL